MIKSFCVAIVLASPFLLSPAVAEEQPGDTDNDRDKDKDKDRIVAIERAEAEYPKKALNKCVEGHVLVRFVITTEGTTRDIEVLSSRPEGVFEKAAVAAVEKWLFEPRILNGVAVNRETTQRLVFEPGCIR